MLGGSDKEQTASTAGTGTTPTLRTVLTALGSSLLSVLSAPHGLDVRVGVPVIHDPSEELAEEADGILLLVGAIPTALTTVDGFRSASRNGYAAVVAKLHGQDPQPLIDASQETGIVSLVCADELPWRRLDALVSAAIGVGIGTGSSLQTGDMFSLANAVAGVLGGAVAIEDAARNVVAYSTLPDQRIDQVRSQGILARRIPDLPKHDQQYREVFAAPGIIHYPFDAATDELPRAAIAVRAGGEVFGSIWVIEEHPPLVADENKVLVDASKMAALYFLRARTAGDLERQTRGEMLRSLLEGRVAPSSTAESLGLRATERFAVVGFSCTNVNQTEPVPFSARLGTEVSRYTSAFRPDVSSVVIGRTVYALMPSLDDEWLAVRFARDVASQAESVLGRPVRAAVRVATSLLTGPPLRDEIDEVLQVLTEDRDAPHVATAQQVHNRILIARLNDALERYPDVLHPSVEALRAHDRERGTTYCQTLLSYFRTMGNVGAAARQLRIHPNTLRYRLHRAQSVFGLNLDDPDESLLVWMQLRLLGDPAEQGRVEPRPPRLRQSR